MRVQEGSRPSPCHRLLPAAYSGLAISIIAVGLMYGLIKCPIKMPRGVFFLALCVCRRGANGPVEPCADRGRTGLVWGDALMPHRCDQGFHQHVNNEIYCSKSILKEGKQGTEL